MRARLFAFPLVLAACTVPGLAAPSASKQAASLGSPGSTRDPADAPSTVRVIPAAALSPMVHIAGGAFLLGRADGLEFEGPVLWTKITPFDLDRTEVTVAAYSACVDATVCTRAEIGGACNWGVVDHASHPINCVDWNQATAFCGWLGKRLPSEEEWEFAARGDQRSYPWGNDPPTAEPSAPSPLLCWHRAQELGTCPVGNFPAGASLSGALDLAGNVWEWVSSGYSPQHGAQRSRFARVARGGAWDSDEPWEVRSTLRFRAPAALTDEALGFRCAR